MDCGAFQLIVRSTCVPVDYSFSLEFFGHSREVLSSSSRNVLWECRFDSPSAAYYVAKKREQVDCCWSLCIGKGKKRKSATPKNQKKRTEIFKVMNVGQPPSSFSRERFNFFCLTNYLITMIRWERLASHSVLRHTVGNYCFCRHTAFFRSTEIGRSISSDPRKCWTAAAAAANLFRRFELFHIRFFFSIFKTVRVRRGGCWEYFAPIENGLRRGGRQKRTEDHRLEQHNAIREQVGKCHVGRQMWWIDDHRM